MVQTPFFKAGEQVKFYSERRFLGLRKENVQFCRLRDRHYFKAGVKAEE